MRSGLAANVPHPANGEGYGDVDGAASGLGANVVRKPSLRQQEKAPEGRDPHVPPADDDDNETAVPALKRQNTPPENEAGPAPVESRFTEAL